MTLFFGANDAAMPAPNGTDHSIKQHVPLLEYVDNLRFLIERIRQKGIQNILLITPPPIYEPARKAAAVARMGSIAESWPPDRTNDFTHTYATACKDLGIELNIPVVDLWTAMQVEKDWGTRLLEDGLHFTIEGNKMVFEHVHKALIQSFPSLQFESLPLHYPHWDMVDAACPERSLGPQAPWRQPRV